MDRLVALYRFALRSGNRPLAARLRPLLRADPGLRREADRSLRELPRGEPRWSASAERALREVVERLARLAP
jgi:hypothetical protein